MWRSLTTKQIILQLYGEDCNFNETDLIIRSNTKIRLKFKKKQQIYQERKSELAWIYWKNGTGIEKVVFISSKSIMTSCWCVASRILVQTPWGCQFGRKWPIRYSQQDGPSDWIYVIETLLLWLDIFSSTRLLNLSHLTYPL